MMNEYYEREFIRIMMKRAGCLPIALLLLVLLLSSCSTSKTSELTEIVDTVTNRQADTLRIYVEKEVHDTVKLVTEKTIIINEKGDTLKETNNNNYFQRIVEHDLTDVYKSRLDSLSERMRQLQESEKVITKQPTIFAKFKYYALGAFIALVVFFVLSYYFKNK